MRATLSLLLAVAALGCSSFNAEPRRRDAAVSPDAPSPDAPSPDAPSPDAPAPDAPAPDVPAMVTEPCGGACPAGAACCENRCVDLATDPQNCGGCASACRSTNASERCQAGRCVPLCFPSFGDCDNSPFNGCEVNLAESVFNCGACARECSQNHATPRCDTGRCLLTCDPGWGNCDGDPSNGCELNILTSTEACGGCGTACFAPNNNRVRCAGGTCRYFCEAGFADCNNDDSDGCEVALGADVSHCGACRNRCPDVGGRVAACADGNCGASAECTAGLADCDGRSDNGCEVDLRSSLQHCGRCGAACGARNATATCAAGRCGLTCAPGFADCDGNNANGCEVDTRSSPTDCGACDRACALPNATAACVAGACAVAACAAGFGDCDGRADNGCETNTLTSLDHCGACGRGCRIANGVGVCTQGICRVASCNAPAADCNNNPADGCETNLAVDPRSCGRCGLRCEPVRGTGQCVAGACRVMSCFNTFGDCNGSYADGCETSLLVTSAHCGACGRACPNGRVCVLGACP